MLLLGASQEKGFKRTLFQISPSDRLMAEMLLKFIYFVENYLNLLSIGTSVPSSRMLEDDLKLSSDEEEGEQVSSPRALCCLGVAQ